MPSSDWYEFNGDRVPDVTTIDLVLMRTSFRTTEGFMHHKLSAKVHWDDTCLLIQFCSLFNLNFFESKETEPKFEFLAS